MWKKLDELGEDTYEELSNLRDYVKTYNGKEHEKDISKILKGIRDGLCHSCVYSNINYHGSDTENITNIAIGVKSKEIKEYEFEKCKDKFDFVFECNVNDFKKIVKQIALFYKTHSEFLFNIN